MDSININIDALADTISKLQGLQREWSGKTFSRPQKIGGGTTVEELEKISDTYKSLNDNIATLLANTAGFLENVKNSFVNSDRSAATGFVK